ncbi:MAG: amidohydrolase family protein [Anaerolineae bacterium]|nr:amidohydrolase family protein [Anaerolineae bacterium]
MIIDFHTHITAPEIIARRDEYLVRDAWFRDLYANPKARLSSAEDLVAAMDEANVRQAVVFGFGWRDMDLCKRDNDYVIQSVTRYPDRLLGFCIVNPAAGKEAVREIERCAAAGLLGIGELMPDGQGYRLDEEKAMAPIVEVALAHRMVLLTHCSEPVGHLYPGKGTVTPDEVIRFARLFPEATLVCAHWGGGTIFYELMPEVSGLMRNVYYDTAASLYLYQDDIFHLAARWAPGKVLFATDYPLLTAKRMIARMEAVRMPTATLRRMLGGNAWRVLRLGERGA